MNNFCIRMKHTNLEYYPSSAFDNSDYEICFYSNLDVNETGWVEIDFPTQFNYNNIDNLIIDVSFDNSNYTSSGQCLSTSTTSYRSITRHTDGGGDPLVWTSGSRDIIIPNMQLYFN